MVSEVRAAQLHPPVELPPPLLPLLDEDEVEADKPELVTPVVPVLLPDPVVLPELELLDEALELLDEALELLDEELELLDEERAPLELLDEELELLDDAPLELLEVLALVPLVLVPSEPEPALPLVESRA